MCSFSLGQETPGFWAQEDRSNRETEKRGALGSKSEGQQGDVDLGRPCRGRGVPAQTYKSYGSGHTDNHTHTTQLGHSYTENTAMRW